MFLCSDTKSTTAETTETMTGVRAMTAEMMPGSASAAICARSGRICATRPMICTTTGVSSSAACTSVGRTWEAAWIRSGRSCPTEPMICGSSPISCTSASETAGIAAASDWPSTSPSCPKLPTAACAAAVSWGPSASMDGCRAAVTWSITGISPVNSTFNESSAGVATDAPSRDRAACTFARAPWKVSPPAWAAPPSPACMADANVAKSICPLLTMSETSADVTPSWDDRNCNTGTPALVSWSRSSPCSFPRAATEEKIAPTSDSDFPEIWAVSATVVRTVCICWPESTPAADNAAATDAASPSP